MLHGHQYRALVHVEPDGVGVAAVVDQGQGRVDGCPKSLQAEGWLQRVDLMGVVSSGTDDLVDNSEYKGFHLNKILAG